MSAGGANLSCWRRTSARGGYERLTSDVLLVVQFIATSIASMTDHQRRRFPPPWTFDEANHACFIVRDGNRFPVAYVYFGSGPGRRAAAHLMTEDEARRIAAGIAKLPALVRGRPTEEGE